MWSGSIRPHHNRLPNLILTRSILGSRRKVSNPFRRHRISEGRQADATSPGIGSCPEKTSWSLTEQPIWALDTEVRGCRVPVEN
jgi:hypothetical protein